MGCWATNLAVPRQWVLDEPFDPAAYPGPVPPADPSAINSNTAPEAAGGRIFLDLPKDVYSGLFKAFVFGILVAAIGCIRGMQTRGGAVAVGKSTTSAVVSGLILIAIADMLLAVIYYHLGW